VDARAFLDLEAEEEEGEEEEEEEEEGDDRLMADFSE
jgi:hypothetical protein